MNPKEPVTTKAMRESEEEGVKLGISKLIMMENAGSALANFVVSWALDSRPHLELEAATLPALTPKVSVLIIAGTGNNGGDAFVAARHLSYFRSLFDLTVVLLGTHSDIRSEEASINWKILSGIHSVERIELNLDERVPEIRDIIALSSVLVVGIFGTGFKGRPRELQEKVITAINQRDKERSFCVSADIPSGMDADTGACEYSVDSDATVTMHAPKVGMFASGESRRKCGRIITANIGLPE